MHEGTIILLLSRYCRKVYRLMYSAIGGREERGERRGEGRKGEGRSGEGRSGEGRGREGRGGKEKGGEEWGRDGRREER